MYGSDGTGYNIHTGQYRSKFDGLGAIVDSHEYVYRDLGAVESVHETGRELYRKFDGERGARKFDEYGGGRNAIGMMCSGTVDTHNGAFTQAYGFYQPQRNKFLDDFVKIHEEVHGLHAAHRITDVATGKEYQHGIMLLEDQMRADGYDTSVITQYRDFHKLGNHEHGTAAEEQATAAKEFVANLGAFYRMEKLGYSDEQLRYHADNYRAPQMQEAYQAFMKAKGKEAQPHNAPSLEERIAGFRQPIMPAIQPLPEARPQAVKSAVIATDAEDDEYGILGLFKRIYKWWYMRTYASRQQPYARGTPKQSYAAPKRAYGAAYA
jgi:hypothetical protein